MSKTLPPATFPHSAFRIPHSASCILHIPHFCSSVVPQFRGSVVPQFRGTQARPYICGNAGAEVSGRPPETTPRRRLQPHTSSVCPRCAHCAVAETRWRTMRPDGRVTCVCDCCPSGKCRVTSVPSIHVYIHIHSQHWFIGLHSDRTSGSRETEEHGPRLRRG